MKKVLDQSLEVKSIILRGCQTYKELLQLLKDKEAPTKDFETFVNYMVYNFYNSEDFFAILITIKNNSNKYENYIAENIIFRDILKEIMEDYIELN